LEKITNKKTRSLAKKVARCLGSNHLAKFIKET
jgi:hypothetical protein